MRQASHRPDIEVIPIHKIDDAYKKVEDGEVRFRYVIDKNSLGQERRTRTLTDRSTVREDSGSPPEFRHLRPAAAR